MKLSPRKLNLFTLTKLPSAYLCGVRVKHLDASSCKVTVKHRWINQNPFKSMFWAVQGMAAELATGALMIGKIQDTGQRISMLVTANRATFTKKATGRITFTCDGGDQIDAVLQTAIATGEGQTLTLTAVGVNTEGITVAKFHFEWSIKRKA
jgi:predicted alpha/beta-hydrolase family hydrolase